MTIRRDLSELEVQGLIRRFHGGAISARGRAFEPPLFTRSIKYQKEKEIIGRYAAQMITEGDTIALDVGSTIYQVAVNIKDKKNITIITPSLPIAQLFYDQSDIRLIIPGGIVRAVENSLIGEITRRNLEQFYVDRLFLGAGAINVDNGITEYNMDDAQIKQIMIRNAKEVVLVADSSKFQKTTFAFVAELKQVNHLITNATPPIEILKYLESNDISLHVVDEKRVYNNFVDIK